LLLGQKSEANNLNYEHNIVRMYLKSTLNHIEIFTVGISPGTQTTIQVEASGFVRLAYMCSLRTMDYRQNTSDVTE